MGKIYMIGAMKGGVGKSVSVFNLAYSLKKRGKKVLAVDFDPQSNLTTCFGAEEVDVAIGDLMMNMIEEEDLPEREEYIWERNGVDFIPASIGLSAVEAKLIAIPENNAKNSAPQSVNYCVTDFRRTPVRLQICSLQFALCSTAFFALFSGLAIGWKWVRRRCCQPFWNR